jgi:hypothetical protein
MKRKLFFGLMLLSAVNVLFTSCKKEEEDEGLLPNIVFIEGGSYISTDQTIPGDSTILIGIHAVKAEPQDVLKKFNISKSINGATAISVYDATLSGADGDDYTYVYTPTLDTIPGQTEKFTFTVTNRDGLVNSKSVTITIQ